MKTFGKYQVVEKIAAGGFGEVYKGFDPVIKRYVAIKTCHAGDERARGRFRLEAEISGNLHHRNITTIYDFGEEGDQAYLVQELLAGEGLDQKIKRRDEISLSERLLYLLQIARGMEYAHHRGVIHRDLKPSNVHILPDGTAKLMDFGIARLLHQESGLTMTGQTVGTTAYLSPEQIRGETIDQRTDIFSFGALAYELITFERAFRGDTISALMYDILERDPEPIETYWPRCPEIISRTIARFLEKDPERRFQSFTEVIEKLARVREEVSTKGALIQTQTPDAEAGPVTATAAPAVSPPARGRRRRLTVAALATGALVVAASLWLGWPATLKDRAAALLRPAAQGPGLDGAADSLEGPVPPAEAPVEAPPETAEPAAPADPQPDGEPLPEAPRAEAVRVESEPPGAQLRVNGELAAEVTPATLELAPGDRIQVELSGYEPVGLDFDAEGLARDDAGAGRLTFALVPVVRPGVLVARAPYSLRLEVDGRTHGPGRELEVRLPPGLYRVRARSSEVFLDSRLEVNIESERRSEIALPPAVPTRIEAYPTSASIAIDGVDQGFVPVEVRLVEGTHEIVFDWGDGAVLPVTQEIPAEENRVFRRKPEA